MSEQEFQELLQNLIDFAADQTEDDASDLGLDTEWLNARTRTFEEAGTLTRDKGLNVRMMDGSRFQLTIIRVS